MSRSYLTQRIANSLPMNSDARQRRHSVLQQFLNPTGNAIQDLYKYIITETNNVFLMKANLEQIDAVHILRLPSEFQFGIYKNDLNNLTYVSPTLVGSTDSLTYPITVVDTLKDFWLEALPTRVSYTGKVKDIIPVLETTTLANLDSTTLEEITHPNRLMITIAGCTSFVDLSRREKTSFLMLTGTTISDIEDSEQLTIPYNGTFLTKKVWKTLSSVEYYGLTPETGTIAIECFAFQRPREADKFQLFITPTQEKLLYHTLGSHNFTEGTYSTHCLQTVVARTLNELYSGFDDLQTIVEIELTYNGSNLLLYDMAVQPYTGRLFAIDHDYLYVFDQYPAAYDYTDLNRGTAGAAIYIESRSQDYLRGQSVTLNPLMRSLIKGVYRMRWQVKEPSGTFSYIDADGVSGSDSDVWIYNVNHTTLKFGPFSTKSGDAYSKAGLTYTLSTAGTYIFYLEVAFTDGTIQIDAFPVQAHAKEALTRIELPIQVKDADGICFDADNRLWLYKQTGDSGRYMEYETPSAYHSLYNLHGCAFEVDLKSDTALIDFSKKIIYLHEEYDSVDVTESDDIEAEL